MIDAKSLVVVFWGTITVLMGCKLPISMSEVQQFLDSIDAYANLVFLVTCIFLLSLFLDAIFFRTSFHTLSQTFGSMQGHEANRIVKVETLKHNVFNVLS